MHRSPIGARAAGRSAQLELFGPSELASARPPSPEPGEPAPDSASTCPPQPASQLPGPGPAETESNGMALVRQVLSAADGHGYFLSDPAGHTSASCWRASTLTDPGTGTSTLVATEPGEAAMVAQLLGRGWLARATRRRTRIAVRGDRPSGRRRSEVAVDAVTATAAARAALLRWSSLAAVPVQRPGPIDHPYPHPSTGGPLP